MRVEGTRGCLCVLTRCDVTREQGLLNTERCKRLMVGVCRDLRGVAAGAAAHSLFPVLFDVLYPNYLPLFTKGLELWGDDPAISTSVLKFWMEFADTPVATPGAYRFPAASPAPLIIFKELCSAIQAYARRTSSSPAPPAGDEYKQRYKGLSIAMASFASAVGGDSCSHLGAMGVYGDPSFKDTASLLVHMSLGIPWDQIMSFPKVIAPINARV